MKKLIQKEEVVQKIYQFKMSIYKNFIQNSDGNFKSVFLLFIFLIILIIFFSFKLYYDINFLTREDFPHKEIAIKIEIGTSASNILQLLEKEKIIASSKTAFLYLNFFKDPKKIQAGEYFFRGEAETIKSVINRIVTGDLRLETKKILVYEGEANFEIGEEISKFLENFDENIFLDLAKDKEGYLFPDTYLVSPEIYTQDLLSLFEKNFQDKTFFLKKQAESLGKNWEEIIVKASLIEKEANGSDIEIKKEISGVIENRLAKNMHLQIDAVFSYIYQRHLPKIYFIHLEVDNPYNTYKYKGLPPSPIGNPGIDSIEAAIFPNETDNFFYLTGSDGKFYFAETGGEHFENLEKI